MKSSVCPESPIASGASSQAPPDDVYNSAPLPIRSGSTNRSGKVVQTSGVTSGEIHCVEGEFSTTRRVTNVKPPVLEMSERIVAGESISDRHPRKRKEGGMRTRGRYKTDRGSPHFPPLVSIITVVFNGARTLEDTILSVLGQTYDNVEFIVIDGESTDGTIEIIRRHEQAIDYWLSEPDGGIYDAMNKGCDLATGTWIYFLGADDRIFDADVLSTVFRAGRVKSQARFGDVVYETGALFESSIDYRMNIANRVHHQSVFYHASLFERFRYDTSYPVVADYELNYRIYVGKARYERLGFTIARCGARGVSKTNKELVNYADYFKIRRKYINSVLSLFFYVVGTTNLFFHFLRQWKAEEVLVRRD